jgi:hypothetical protein
VSRTKFRFLFDSKFDSSSSHNKNTIQGTKAGVNCWSETDQRLTVVFALLLQLWTSCGQFDLFLCLRAMIPLCHDVIHVMTS